VTAGSGADVAVDWGSKRVGIAVCISGVVVPQEPLLAPTPKRLAGRLREIARDYGPGRVVLGFPLAASGNRIPLCDEVEALAEKLREEGFEVHLQRETGTTLEARDLRGSHRRDGKTDSLAAAIVLKRFLRMA
jgi:putative transcription antitermination factor YqgF